MVLSDRVIIEQALKTYAEKLRGVECLIDQTKLVNKNTLDRVMELRDMEIKVNDIAIAIIHNP